MVKGDSASEIKSAAGTKAPSGTEPGIAKPESSNDKAVDLSKERIIPVPKSGEESAAGEPDDSDAETIPRRSTRSRAKHTKATTKADFTKNESQADSRIEDESSSEDELVSNYISNHFTEAEEEKVERAKKPMSLNAKCRAQEDRKAANLIKERVAAAAKPLNSWQKAKETKEAEKDAKPPVKLNRSKAVDAAKVEGKAKTKAEGKAVKPEPATNPKAAPKSPRKPAAKKGKKASTSLVESQPTSPINTTGSTAQVLEIIKTPAARPSVLVRGTARSSDYRKIHTDEFKASAKAVETVWTAPFRILDLPAELRNRIWRLVVKEDVTFVWPGLRPRVEQPNLSQVSRQVRGEVLPIYYRENIFALNVSPPYVRRLTTAGVFARTDQWAAKLSEKKHLSDQADISVSQDWFALIRHWAFLADVEVDDPEPNYHNITPSEDRMCFISVTFPTKDQRGGVCEVHTEAACLLPAIANRVDMCLVQKLPTWVGKVLSKAGLGSRARASAVKRWQVAELAEGFRKTAREIEAWKCEKIVASVET